MTIVRKGKIALGKEKKMDKWYIGWIDNAPQLFHADDKFGKHAIADPQAGDVGYEAVVGPFDSHEEAEAEAN